jgi:predicted AAA+ superfamily ATPase
MKEYYKELIIDFAERDLTAIKPREILLPKEPGRIITVIGARRVGKTYLLLHHINRLRKETHPSKMLYVNFENDKLFPFTLEKAQQLIETYYEIYPSYKSEKVYFFFDEIQNIPEWHLFIRRLYDTENCFIFLTGSSSRLLSKEISTSLRGRTITFELFPLSFREYIQWHGFKTAENYSSKQKAELINAFHRYLGSSALPELVNELDISLQQAVLHEYVNMVVYKDLIERHGLTQHTLIKLFIRFLTVNISNPISINKLFNDFKSQGLQLSKNSLYEYLNYLEDSYIFYNINVYSTNLREQQRNPKKIYAVDIGLKLLMDFQVDKGRLLENLVYLQLRRKHQEIHYLKGIQEVDFCFFSDGVLQLINVAYSISEKDTYDREINSLQEAMNRLTIFESTLIIGNGNRSNIAINNCQINIVPAWQWLLKNGKDFLMIK